MISKREVSMFSLLKRLWMKISAAVHEFIFWLSHTLLLPLRYKVKVLGAESLNPKKGGVNHSILFLANHSSYIDATIIATEVLQQHLSLSIWALDLTFKLPYLRWAARRKETIQVVKVPNIPERRSEKHNTNLHKLVTRTADGLKKGKNFLIFPSGVVKRTPLETIDGKSAVPLIIKQFPEVKIVLIRVTGLWGSRFSGATPAEKRWSTRNVSPFKMFYQACKMLVLNGLFFIPKRNVLVEFIPAPPDFPFNGSRLEIDRYLEKVFNENWGPLGEPLYRVPDYFWKPEFIDYGYQVKNYNFNLNQVPKTLRNSIVTLIANIADLDCKEIGFGMDLRRDIGLDSLQIVQLLMHIEMRYGVKRLVPDDVTTVGHLIAIAGKIPIACEVKHGEFHTIHEHLPIKPKSGD